MKTRKLFFAGLAALAFAACNNDELVENAAPAIDPTESGEPTWVTVRLGVNQTSSKTRAVKPDGDDEVTSATGSYDDNNTVSDATLLIFNASTRVLEKRVDFVDGETTAKILSTPGDKKIYALANIKGTPFETAIGSLVEKSSVISDYLEKTFEAKDLSTLVPTVGGKVNYVATSTEAASARRLDAGVEKDDDEGNKITFNLKYVVAKVGLKLKNDDAAIVKDMGVVSDLRYALRNLARESYIAQQNPIVGVYSKQKGHTDVAEWRKFFFVPSFDKNLSIKSTDPSEFFLASENVNEVPVVGNTTYAAIRGVFTPDNVVTGVTYSELTGKVTPIYGSISSNTTFYINKTDTIESIKSGTILADSSLVRKGLAKLALMKDNVSDAEVAAQVPVWTAGKHFVTYTNGVCWYRMNIGEGKDDNTEFRVVRGNRYNVIINKITGVGANSDGELDGSEGSTNTPDLPLTQNTYLNATIKVDNWVEANQEGDL